jgi:hypothetical protein
LARQYGIYQVAHTLRLDYMGLKKRLNGMGNRPPDASRTTFLELMTSPSAAPESVIEFESAAGKMRIQWKAAVPPDWSSLLRAWREAAE